MASIQSNHTKDINIAKVPKVIAMIKIHSTNSSISIFCLLFHWFFAFFFHRPFPNLVIHDYETWNVNVPPPPKNLSFLRPGWDKLINIHLLAHWFLEQWLTFCNGIFNYILKNLQSVFWLRSIGSGMCAWLNQWWPKTMTHISITRPQCVKRTHLNIQRNIYACCLSRNVDTGVMILRHCRWSNPEGYIYI